MLIAALFIAIVLAGSSLGTVLVLRQEQKTGETKNYIASLSTGDGR